MRLKAWAAAFALLGASLALSGVAGAAENPVAPILSLSRLSAGVGAAAVLTEERETGARAWGWQPHAYASYSLTPMLSLAGVASRDFDGELTVLQGGVRLAVAGFAPGDKLQAGFGVDAVRYEGDGAESYEEENSWLASVRLAWAVWQTSPTRDVLWAVAQAETDPENGVTGRTFYKLGLRWQIVGP